MIIIHWLRRIFPLNMYTTILLFIIMWIVLCIYAFIKSFIPLECQICGYIFKPKWYRVVHQHPSKWAIYLRCPRCEEKNWCRIHFKKRGKGVRSKSYEMK